MFWLILQVRMKLQKHFKKTSDALGKMQWKIEVRKCEKTPGCFCKTKKIKCRQGLCIRKAGIVEIKVICGFTYNIYEEIETATSRMNSKIRLARVTWRDQENEHHDVGLVLDSAVAAALKNELDRKVIHEAEKNREIAEREASPPRPQISLSEFDMFD